MAKPLGTSFVVGKLKWGQEASPNRINKLTAEGSLVIGICRIELQKLPGTRTGFVDNTVLQLVGR